jgi:hypothetical protein
VYVQGNRCLMISTFPFLTIDSIAPFNFPAMIPLWTIPLAAVTGNTPKNEVGKDHEAKMSSQETLWSSSPPNVILVQR